MSLQDTNWYGLNGARLYPLDDAATGKDDTGNTLPDDILVDAAIRFPSSAGNYACLAAVTVTKTLVTVVLQAATGILRPTSALAAPASPVYTPLATISLPQPVTPYISYALTPILANSGGWLVFGPGVNTPYQGKFSTLAQGAFLPRCASFYASPVVTGIGRKFCADPITGLARINAGNDLYVKIEKRAIGNSVIDAVVIGLNPNTSRDVFQYYSGPCGKRPESGTCTPPGITQINTTVPDYKGNINITWKNIRPYPYATGAGGVALNIPYQLSDVCPKKVLPDPTTGALPNTGNDDCVNPPPVINLPAPRIAMMPPPAPVTEIEFNGASTPMRVVSGLFSAGRTGYAAESAEAPNLSLLPETETLRSSTLTLELPGASRTAAGFLLDYRDAENYAMVLLDSATKALEFWTVRQGRQRISRTPLAKFGAGRAQLEIKLSRDSEQILQVAAAVKGAAIGAMTWRGNSEAGRVGLAAIGDRAVFHSLHWERA